MLFILSSRSVARFQSVPSRIPSSIFNKAVSIISFCDDDDDDVLLESLCSVLSLLIFSSSSLFSSASSSIFNGPNFFFSFAVPSLIVASFKITAITNPRGSAGKRRTNRFNSSVASRKQPRLMKKEISFARREGEGIIVGAGMTSLFWICGSYQHEFMAARRKYAGISNPASSRSVLFR